MYRKFSIQNKERKATMSEGRVVVVGHNLSDQTSTGVKIGTNTYINTKQKMFFSGRFRHKQYTGPR